MLIPASPFILPVEVRQACRENQLPIFASDALGGFLCVNVVMIPAAHAEEFEGFCRMNPVPCPLLHIMPPGEISASGFAVDLDIRTDLRSYDVIRFGETTESVPDVIGEFAHDTVTFLIGSSVSLDGYLSAQGLGPSWGPCIYITTKLCEPWGRFQGPMAVTMRSYPRARGRTVATETAHFPACHGGPIAVNDFAALGISSETMAFLPFKGGGVAPSEDNKLFWACGITPSLVARAAKLPLMIVHTPGNALITDIPMDAMRHRRPAVRGE